VEVPLRDFAHIDHRRRSPVSSSGCVVMTQAVRGQIILADRTEQMLVACTQRRDGAGDEIVVREPGALKQIQQTGGGGGTLSPTTGGGGGNGS
jgi:hypothetical protein